MSKINEKLNLLLLLDQVDIEECDNYYEIKCKHHNVDLKTIIAYIDKTNNRVSYYIGDVYNNSSNEEEIDMEQIRLLSKVIKELTGEVKC